MEKNCRQCGLVFEIANEDMSFYEMISPVFDEKKFLIPAPNFCPDCRCQRRQSCRNERAYYHRKCDLCGKQIISIFSPNKNAPVYCQNCWWGDGWSSLNYGMDFDFDKPFFPQFKELTQKVPRISMVNNKPENSEYCNQTTGVKDCYLCCNSVFSESCFYSKGLSNCRSVMDCLRVYNCELCYECIDCHDCYNGVSLRECRNCSDCLLCKDCIGCKNCFGSIGLRNKQYFLFNEKLSKEEYEKSLEYFLDNKKEAQGKFQKLYFSVPHRFATVINCENSTGDNLHDSKNAKNCFDVVGGENIRYCYDSRAYNDNSYDVASIGNNITHSYHTISSGINMTHGLFLENCFDNVSDLTYCHLCVTGTSNCLGCVSLKHAKYCIFNKQYSKDEYEKLAAKIVEHMIQTGEWGDFFPFDLSHFGYNETLANEYYPLTKKEALRLGANWSDYETGTQFHGNPFNIPKKIKDVTDEICKEVLVCEVTGRPYKILKSELDFYRKMHLPIPTKSPDQRHRDRMALRNHRKLWRRNCAKCGMGVESTFDPDRAEIVYCEKCYQNWAI